MAAVFTFGRELRYLSVKALSSWLKPLQGIRVAPMIRVPVKKENNLVFIALVFMVFTLNPVQRKTIMARDKNIRCRAG
jgi:hypothetical protein